MPDHYESPWREERDALRAPRRASNGQHHRRRYEEDAVMRGGLGDDDTPPPSRRKRRESGTGDERASPRRKNRESYTGDERESPRRKRRESYAHDYADESPPRRAGRKNGMENEPTGSRRKQRDSYGRVDDDTPPRRKRMDPRERGERAIVVEKTRERESKHSSSQSTAQLLSEDALRALDSGNEKIMYREKERDRKRVVEKVKAERRKKKRRKRRLVSGPLLEEGRVERRRDKRSWFAWASMAGGERGRLCGKKMLILIAIILLVLIIAIPVAITVSKKKKNSGPGISSSSSGSDPPANTELHGLSQDSIPAAAKGTILDPFSWYDTTNFNVTYTDEKVGGLPIMGLNSTWSDKTSPNPTVPPISQHWDYTKTPARGVNLGGWLSLEPFVTPSLFNSYDSSLGIVDEYTLTSHLGPEKSKQILEQHYASFVTESTFAEIAAAGLDHVRIPYSYWAVTTYPGDPYLSQVSWRYLLRGIEWARNHGLRVNLDIHGLPGSQNGWNHSGRWGAIGWLNGTDGDVNAQRSIDVHDQLSTFFAQDRYKSIITLYGLCNEPKMTKLPKEQVLNWTTTVTNVIRKNGVNATVVFGDGFLGLENWTGELQGLGGTNGAVLDVHQYVIFNVDQVVFTHQQKVQFACQGWTNQTVSSMNTATGYGAILCAEWSQADTDCALYLNNVGVGSRWAGTFQQTPAAYAAPAVLTPTCPGGSGNRGANACECSDANADPSRYSATYKQFLKMFAEAQMNSFEKGWGWFYWNWDTEQSPQWSYKQGLKAGILPALAYQPDFKCDKDIPDFGAQGLPEIY